MKSRIWIILAILLLCNAIGYAVLMADIEANAAEKTHTPLPLKASVAPAGAAAFNSIVVNTTADENGTNSAACSLREAIRSANGDTGIGGCAAGSGSDVITFNATVFPANGSKLIELMTIMPDISTSMEILGPGPEALAVERSHSAARSRVLNVVGGGSVVVKISGLTISNGLEALSGTSQRNGMGIQNSANLTLESVTIAGNNPGDSSDSSSDIQFPQANGGGIANSGTLTLNNCDIFNNRGGSGGGIYNSGTIIMSPTITINGQTRVPTLSIGGNQAVTNVGGGIYNIGTITLARCTLKGNLAEAGDGGAIYNAGGGTITLTNASIGNNDVAASGKGVAIYNEGNTPTNSTINLRSVTIGKHANPNGDPEHDAAIYLDADARLVYRNSIFSDYFTDGTNEFVNVYDNGGTMTSEGHNISNDATVTLNAGLGDLPGGTDPLLDNAGLATHGSAAENPDRIETFRLNCGSPAIDAAWSSGGSAAPTTDARSAARYDDPATAPNGSALPDIGSYEFNYQITTDSNLPTFTQGTSYSTMLVAQNGDNTPYTWTLASGSLPPGLSLTYISSPPNSADYGKGVISGMPTSGGTFTFTVQVAPAFSTYCSLTKTFTLSGGGVSCSTITIPTPATLNTLTCDTPFVSQTLGASGGTGPYGYTVTGGALPSGLSLTLAGLLSGTPTVVGAYSFTVTAADANSCTGARTFSGTVGCPVITVNPSNPTLTAGTTGTAYSQSFTSSKAGSVFSVTAGALPNGLTLSGAGALTGSPTASGTFNFTVTATVGTAPNTCTGSRAYALTINCPTITLSATTLPNATCDTAYTSPTLSASGGASPYSFTLQAGSSLPAGLSLSTGGVISGTPSVVGSFSFTICATDANGCKGTRAYSLTIGCPTITVSPAGTTLSAATGQSFSQTFTSSKAGATFSLSGTLPTGLSFTNGVLSGTPTQSGTFSNIVVTATTGVAPNTCAGSTTYTLTVNCPTITLSATALPNATCDTAYTSPTLSASGGASPYNFTLQAGSSLPTGLSLSTGGVISGTPSVVGSFNFTICATDANGCKGTRAYSLTIGCPIITVSPASATLSATQGTPYSQTFTSSKAEATLSLTGTLPTGLTFSNGVLSGTPTQSGTFNNIVVTATTGVAPNTCTGSRTYTLTVTSNNTAPTINGSTVARQKGSPAGAAVTIATVSDAQSSAGSLTVTQVSGGTATGITVSGITNSGGTITALVSASCTAAAGTVKLRVSDGTLTTDGDLTITLTDNAAPNLSYTAQVPVLVGTSVTFNPAATVSDNGTVTSIVRQSVTPAGAASAITVNNATGAVTVNNTLAIGQYTVIVRATDNCGATTDATLSFTVIGSLLVSEFAFSGPNGPEDWFVELYNNTSSVQSTAGLSLGFVSPAGTFFTVALPNTTIPARGYYLVKGVASSLTGVTADFTATVPFAGFVPAGVALCRGPVDQVALRLDSAGMNNLPGGHPYIEAAPLAWLNNPTAVYSFMRKFSNTGLPVDTNVNAVDFILIAPSATTLNGIPTTPGAVGPQSATSPQVNNNAVPAALLNPAVSAGNVPNSVIDTNSVTQGTTTYPRSLFLRRTFTNNTGAAVTKLRFRIIEISNGGTNTAILRALNSSDVSLTVNGQPVTVRGLTLDAPPASPNGGGVNSTLSVGAITLGLPLANNTQVAVQFRLGILQGGNYRFFVNVEAQ